MRVGVGEEKRMLWGGRGGIMEVGRKGGRMKSGSGGKESRSEG